VKTTTSRPKPVREAPPPSSTNPFPVDSSDSEALDDSNPFASQASTTAATTAQLPPTSSNPFGDIESSDSEYPDNEISKPTNAAKYETYDKTMNPFESAFNAVPETTPAAVNTKVKRPAPKKPSRPPMRPPPPDQNKLRSSTVTSSDHSTGSGDAVKRPTTKASTKRTAPSAPVAPRRPNYSQIDYDAKLEHLERVAYEMSQIALEMDELEETINEPRPSKFTQDRWDELVKRKTEATMLQNKLLLEKELYEVCEQHCTIEYKMRVLNSKAVRSDQEERELDILGQRLSRIINTKAQIDEQLHPTGPDPTAGCKKSKKKGLTMGLGKSFKRLTLKPK